MTKYETSKKMEENGLNKTLSILRAFLLQLNIAIFVTVIHFLKAITHKSRKKALNYSLPWTMGPEDRMMELILNDICDSHLSEMLDLWIH